MQGFKTFSSWLPNFTDLDRFSTGPQKDIYLVLYFTMLFFLSLDMTFDQSIFSENHAMYDRELTNHRSYRKSLINYLPLIEKSDNMKQPATIPVVPVL